MDKKRFSEWIALKKSLHFGRNEPKISEGDVWWCSFGENIGVEINGKSKDFTRPVLVLKKLGRLGFMGVPLTSQDKSGTWYAEFVFLGRNQRAVVSQARFLSIARLHSKLGQVPYSDLAIVKKAFHALYE